MTKRNASGFALAVALLVSVSSIIRAPWERGVRHEQEA